MSLTPIDFTGDTQASILASLLADYQARTGRIIQPAQVEMLLINAMAYQLELNNQRINSAANQNLAQFAIGAALDLIAADAGVSRLPALPASCTVLITLISGHGAVVMPAGTRIQTQDGLATFITQGDTSIASGVNTLSVTVVCDTAGSFANGYAAGTVSVILDPQPYITSIVSTDATVGGSEIESDDGLRTRFYLAPNSYSTAGSTDSYIFWAKTASPLILDVSVNNGGGGIVNIYPLIAGGATPTEILTAVADVCNGDKVRPLTDTVNVISPSVTNYTVDISLTKYASADSATVLALANSAVNELVFANSQELGIDIIISQIIAAASVTGVAKVVVNTPASDTVLDDTHVGVCTAVTIAITGINSDR